MNLTYASAISGLKTHGQAAADAVWGGGSVDIDIGGPLPTSSRCGRIFYAGETDPAKMGGGSTLSSRMIGERIALVLWIAVSNLSVQEIQALETELYEFKHELRTRVLGDAQLGGMGTDLEMSPVEPDYVVIGSTRYRTLETEFITDYAEYTISP